MNRMNIQCKQTILTVMQGDITRLEVDAIVNAASEELRGGGGVDGAIHRAGGPKILEECKQYSGCPTGEARLTSAGNMPSQYVIHTVGPIYRGGHHEESTFLANAYKNSLEMALKSNIKTIAFPFISAGIYGYPKDEASEIAVKTVVDFLSKHQQAFKEIIFCCFSEKDYLLFCKKLKLFIPTKD